MASALSPLPSLLFTLSLLSTAASLQFSEGVYDFFQQDLSRSISLAPHPMLAPNHPPSISPSPAAYAASTAAANRTFNETTHAPLVSNSAANRTFNRRSHAPLASTYASAAATTKRTFDEASYGPLASAFFIFGDSSVDCGTNNFLGTLARADRLPYGRDFDTHQPTGRFCNGRLAVDYLALRLGLPLVPSYLAHNRSVDDMIHGVNYASAASGIIFSSGSELGQHVAFTQQIQQFMDTFQKFMETFGPEVAVNLISTSVVYISIGTNDYIHYYLRNVSGVQSKYFPWSFNQFLVRNAKQEIKKLYDSSVRKVVVMGLAPMGCAPHYLWKYNSTRGECIHEINDMITEFNYGMRYMVHELNAELQNGSFIFCDVFAAAMELIKNPDRYGFSVTTDACCGVGKYKGWILCISPLMACHNASTHIWWDQFHPTDAVNEMLADNIWSSLHTEMCYPMNLKDMVAQDTR